LETPNIAIHPKLLAVNNTYCSSSEEGSYVLIVLLPKVGRVCYRKAYTTLVSNT